VGGGDSTRVVSDEKKTLAAIDVEDTGGKGPLGKRNHLKGGGRPVERPSRDASLDMQLPGKTRKKSLSMGL